MDIVLAAVGAVAGLAFGVWAGWVLGQRVRERKPWAYWALNAAAFFDGTLVMFLGIWFDQLWLTMAGVFLLGGLLTGLKYGYGKSVGVWRVHDRAVGSDDLLE